MSTTLHITPRRGDRTLNGAVIVDIKRAWDSSGYIVLCLWTEDLQLDNKAPITRTSDPYVTWFARPDDQGRIICYQGHYHDQLSEAVIDFKNRL